MRAPFTAAGEPTPEFTALLALGRDRGFLTPHDVMAVLEGVELRTELISAVIGRVTAEGIEWREPKELLSDEGLVSLVAEVAPDGAEAAGLDGMARHRLLRKKGREPFRTGRRLSVAGLQLEDRCRHSGQLRLGAGLSERDRQGAPSLR